MPIDVPPNLPNYLKSGASAIVRYTDKQNNTPNNSQSERNLRNAAREAVDRKGREPKSSERRPK